MSRASTELPKLDKPSTLYIRGRSGIALGVLSQKLGLAQRAAGYFSKQLDPVPLGWPTCLWAVTATGLLVNEASKLTLGQHLVVLTSYHVSSVLELKDMTG